MGFLTLRGLFALKSFAKFFNCCLPDRLLYVKIVFRHIYVSMTHNALNSCQIHAQSLHLRNIGMSAAMRCQHPHFWNPFKRFLELVPKVRGIAGHIPFAGLPNKLIGCVRQEASLIRDLTAYLLPLGCSFILKPKNSE